MLLRTRVPQLLLALLVMLLVLPATAAASPEPNTIAIDTGRLYVDMPAGDVHSNDIFITLDAGAWVITENGAGTLPPIDATAGDECDADVANRVVTCGGFDINPANGVVLYLGDGDDSATFFGPEPMEFHGEVGNDRLASGSGWDLLMGDEGNDTLSGGIGTDVFDGGPGSFDFVDFSSEGRGTGVQVTLNGLADDTDGGEYIGGSPTSIGIEGIVGTDHADTITGDVNSNLLYGMGGSDTLAGLGGSDDLRGDFGNRGSLYGGSAGNDTITGGTGNDGMYGEAGVDDLQARDGEADGAVNCGTDGGSATVDAEGVDAVVHSCTTVSRPTVVTDTKVDTKPKIAVAGVTVTNLTDTTARVKLPDMRGKHVFTALNMLDKAGIATKITFDTKEMSLSQLPKNIDPEKGKWQAGYILSHTPGTKMVTIGSRTELPLRILVWSGIPRLDCLDQARALTAGKSTDLAFSEFRMVLRDLGCKLDDVRIDLEKTTTQPKEIDRTSGDRCEVDKVFKSGRNTVDVELDIPQDADKQDLRVYTMHSNDGLSMVERDGKLTATYSSYAQAFRVFVGSRSAGQQMNNVTLYVHYKSNDGDYNTTLQSITGAANQADGTARFRVATPKEGTVWIAAVGIDRNGNSVCGSTFIPVVDRGTGNRSKVAPGDVLTTIGGVHWKMTPDASFKRTATATGKSVEPGAKGRLSAKGWIDSIGALWNAIFGKARPQAAAAVLSASDQAAAVKALEAESNLQLALWRVNTGIIGPAAIISGGAGNIISGGAGNIISGGAGNVTGASSVTTAGGNRAFGFQSGTGIISGGAGNFQSGAGVTDMKSSEILATKQFGGAAIISGGAGNIISGGAGNIISGGAGN